MNRHPLAKLTRPVTLLMVMMLVSGMMVVTPASAQESESDQIQDIIERVVSIRGLDELSPISVTFQTRDELQDSVDSDFFEDYTEADVQRDQRTMRAFGIIDEDTDIRDLYSQLYGSQIAGYYDPTTAELVVVTDGDPNEQLSAMDEWTLAHEINHALQDQHFDIDGGAFDTTDTTDDVSLASSALIEGDSTLLQYLYVQKNPRFARALVREINDLDEDEDSLDEFPQVIVDLLLFPYNEGFEFVQELYDEGGYDLVNQAFENPPTTTEHILHPETYLDEELPDEIDLADPMDALSSNWEVTDSNTFGEYLIKSILASDEETERDAEDAAEGWNGDAYTVAANGDASAVVWQSAWESDDDAEELAEVFADHEASRMDADVDEDKGLYTIQGDDFVVLIQVDGDQVTYVQAPDLDTAEDLMDNQLR